MKETAGKRPIWAVAAAAALCLTVLVAVASAHEILSGPTVSGVPQDGQTLTAKAEWKGNVTAETWTWQRCTVAPDKKCTAIKDAAGPTYVLTADDVGFTVRVRLTLTASHGDASKRSKPTSVVQPASAPPPPPEETEEPEPDPEPGDTPDHHDDDDDGTTFNPPANPVVAPAPPAAEGLMVMNPFPVVRISGRLTGSGAVITRLTVRSPHGATVRVRCRGRSCPARRFARAAQRRRLRAFERHLRGGTRLDIVVRQPKRVGKWTTIKIRRGAPPRRIDRCSYPGQGKPAACPAG